MKIPLWITLPIVVLALGLASCGGLPQPVCPTESLVAPILTAPAQMSTVNTVLPTLSWSYPANCHPQGYRIDLSVTADFSDTSLSGGTGDPSTSWAPGEDLTDCTQYYWRVAPINDITLGPFSETRTFSVDVSGACAPSGGTASITGLVWHDLCAVPYASGSPLEPGCIAGSDGAPEANGVLEPGEPGLEGVVVDLGAGSCPSTGLTAATTGSDGSYAFNGLAAGSYCVSVNALVEPNTSILIPGGWTAPVRGDEPATASITVSDGEESSGVNFGWDYQFLPSPPAVTATLVPSSTPVPTPTPPPALGRIGGRIWNDICHYTGGANNEPVVLGDGCIGDPLGVWGANGVMDSGEPVMPGVTFRLGLGSCPSDGYATADSNSAGYFMFINLPANTYCLSLSALLDGNDTLLIPGGVSNWPTTNGVLYITIPLGPGQDRLDIAVGWEWQHLG